MTPIIDNIYLGNACDASYFYRLKNNKYYGYYKCYRRNSQLF